MVTKCATRFPTGKENMNGHPPPPLEGLFKIWFVCGGGGEGG